MKILIDNGHGHNTPGKCSPDHRLAEWRYTREIAAEVEKRLKARRYDACRIVTETHDVSLAERTRRVNSYASRLGKNNVVLVSIHCNAAGADGCWHDAGGWSVFISRSASSRSKALACALHDAARLEGLRTRCPMPSQKYWTAGFAILRNTLCPAVLTENLFQDNRTDVDYLLSPQGREAIINLHVNALINYVNSL